MCRVWILRALLALGGALVALALIVLVLIGRSGLDRWRVTQSRGAYDCSAHRFCRYRPGDYPDQRPLGTGETPWAYHVNALGFRGPDVPEARVDPRTIRVQLFGDSMIFGSGVDDGDTLRANLEEVLRARTGCPVQVQSFGMPMNYFRSNLTAAEAFGARFEPDVLVFAISQVLPNDMNDRLIELEESKVLQWLFDRDWGKWVINQYQTSGTDFFDADAARHATGAALARLAERQARDGKPAVYFFSYFLLDEYPLVSSVDLATLDYRWIPTLSEPRYQERTELQLPGDGHPNPDGHAFYAGYLADALVPALGSCAP